MLVDILMKIARDEQPPMGAYRPRPSGWGRCIRASVYHALGYPAKLFPGRFVMLLEESGFTEDMMADWIRKSSFNLHSQQMPVNVASMPSRRGREPWLCEVCTKASGREVWIESEIIHGHIDGVIQDLMGAEYLWEMKGINHFGFERLEASLQEGLWDDNLVKWVHQDCMYLVGLGKLSSINRLIITVGNRNTSAKLEAIGTYSPALDRFTLESAMSTRVIEDSETGIRGDLRGGFEPMVLDGVVAGFIGYFNRVEELVSAKLLPARPYELSDWHCGYCQWQGTCWEGFEAEINKMLVGVDLPDNLRDQVTAYIVFREEEKRAADQKDITRSIIVNELQAQGIKKCKSPDGVSVTLRIEDRVSIDKELIPPAILKAAERKTQSLKLDVRKAKKEK